MNELSRKAAETPLYEPKPCARIGDGFMGITVRNEEERLREVNSWRDVNSRASKIV